jgi:putative tryptophan/tyrosine transport system substrate-binding protein
VTTREQLHQLVDQVDDDTAEEILGLAEWLLREQAASHALPRAAEHQLPVVCRWREWVEAGGLMSSGAHGQENPRRMAEQVDRIRKGTPPADLPIEQPMRFDFVINAKTAHALGLTMPHHVLLQATEVIQ